MRLQQPSTFVSIWSRYFPQLRAQCAVDLCHFDDDLNVNATNSTNTICLIKKSISPAQSMSWVESISLIERASSVVPIAFGRRRQDHVIHSKNIPN
jgi:hypothetical protein